MLTSDELKTLLVILERIQTKTATYEEQLRLQRSFQQILDLMQAELPLRKFTINLEHFADGNLHIGDVTINDLQTIQQALLEILRSQPPAPPPPPRPKNEKLLLKQVRDEVFGRLEQSLHNHILIHLEKESHSGMVIRPWDAEIKIGSKPSELLPNTTTISEVFDRDEIAGRLLILGAPGSGKTTTLLELAKALLARAEAQPDYPIPVLLNLSSWQATNLKIWLVEELKGKYGVRADLGEKWLDEGKLLPLLDGLDEQDLPYQEPCIQAINELLTGENPPLYLVVCSRSQEYENLIHAHKTYLQLNGAVLLQSLKESQIYQYLQDTNHLELWQGIQCDANLLEIAKIPLFLSIMTLAYQEISLQEWQHLESDHERREYLLNSYIHRMLKRNIKFSGYAKGREPDPEKTKQWLSHLARVLKEDARTEFFIENIQPYWLSTTSQKRGYKFAIGFIFPLIIIFPLILIPFIGVAFKALKLNVSLVELTNIFSPILIFILILLLFCGIIYLRLPIAPSIKIMGRIRWSGRQALLIMSQLLKQRRRYHLLILLVGVLINLPVTLLNKAPLAFLLNSSGSFFLFYVFVLLTFSAFAGLTYSDLERRVFPNQGIWKSAINAGFFTIAFACIPLLFFIFYCLVIGIVSGFNLISITDALYRSGAIFLGASEVAGSVPLLFLSIPASSHFVLRVFLWWNHIAPWNYARFLNYVTKRLFLQRVGGGYRFIHNLLRDHFAQLQVVQGVPIQEQKPWRVIFTLTGKLTGLSAVAISPDGQILASADKTIKLWDLNTGKLLRILEGHSDWLGTIAFSPDGQALASAGLDKTIKLWSISTGKLLSTLQSHANCVNTIVFSLDGQTLASGSLDKTIKVWNPTTGKLLFTLKGHTNSVRSIVISPDNRTLISSSVDGSIKLWNVSTGKFLGMLQAQLEKNIFKRLRKFILPNEAILSLAISPNGKILASGCGDKTVKLWSLATGELIRTLKGHSHVVVSLAISSDSQILASGSFDETIKLWDLNTGELLHNLAGYTQPVRSVAFSPDKQTIVSASTDCVIRIWRKFSNL